MSPLPGTPENPLMLVGQPFVYRLSETARRTDNSSMTTALNIPAFCELDDSGARIDIYFKYNFAAKEAVKAITGKRFHAEGEHGPYWSVPLNMENATKIREIFGDNLELGDAIRAWGHREKRTTRRRRRLSVTDDLSVNTLKIAKTHLELARYLRPYQRADVALMAEANALNCNQPGTGKTVEVLAALAEAGMAEGAHLVVAPVRSLENVWRPEIERWMPGTVYTSEDPTERVAAVWEGRSAAARGETAWILLNIDMIRVRKLAEDSDEPYVKSDHKGVHYAARDKLHEAILATKFTSRTVDEFHKMGLPERMSLATLGMDLIKADRAFMLSGTPMGGKPYKLFAPLRSIEPKKFSSFWRWANEWLEVETEKVRQRGGGVREVKSVGGIKAGREEAFYEAHAQHLIRRLKRDALPGLPEKVRIIVPCGMTKNQQKQYDKFEADAEVRIEGGMVIADNRLAEFSRLKQFANAYCKFDSKGRVVPTEQSEKIQILLEKLSEFGVAPIKYRNGKPLHSDSQIYEPGARAIVASQSSRMVEMVTEFLHKQGIECDSLTGDTKDSRPIIKRFKDGSDTPYVIVMTTDTGGVSLNLEEASSIHILDESWNPDDDEQLEDRGDRGSRTTPLVCLYYRTTDTVQEYIAAVAGGKRVTNRNVLDLYRQAKKLKGKS
jgi:SNF2 family DNA or RNA helicase